MELRFFDDPVLFLDVAADHLAEQPVVSTVVSGVANRIAAEAAEGIAWPEGVPRWFAVVGDGEDIVGAAMRTAPFGSYPAFLLPMPEEAARLLARTLVERDEPMTAANGALPAVQVFCEEMAAHSGGTVRVGQHTRLFELGDLVEPEPVEGRLRPANLDELDLVLSWYDAFMADADEQAGRAPGESPHESLDREAMTRRIEGGRIFVWEDTSGEPVHVTAASQPSYGVSRIGPVFTPREHRGRGIASTAVAQVSKLLRDSGEQACLFTDQANPTSNKIYEALGYRRVVDMANLRVE
ncbi:GNAT family N-acetyltransferase [Nocardioides cynanchi]|uniref:GNAT family N-acetyltransferase n=1 Tax=Nocardioides cynanchi TaxID=2558918 RepID=UPI0012452F3A|nr:GNAT family N-acetyltransferase [Nocardioides cynanchi]